MLDSSLEWKGNLSTIMDIKLLYRIKQNHTGKVAEGDGKSQMPRPYVIPLLRKQEKEKLQTLETEMKQPKEWEELG